MSRHKLVKTLDLDNELDDYDGGEEYDYDGTGQGGDEMSPEDRERMRIATAETFSILGPDVPVTEKEVQDSLWYYYYDVQKTVDYLLKKTTSTNSKKAKKADAASGAADSIAAKKSDGRQFFPSFASSLPTSTQDHVFPRMSPTPVYYLPPKESRTCIGVSWLNDIDEPRPTRGRLLGGNPANAAAPQKTSKLAALAAARKQKENAKPAGGGPSSSVSLLDRLGPAKKPGSTGPSGDADDSSLNASPSEKTNQSLPFRTYPSRKPKEPSPRPVVEPEKLIEKQLTIPQEVQQIIPERVLASPSSFASTLFGPVSASGQQQTGTSIPTAFSPFHDLGIEFSAFASPSPDDIVARAQNSKGSKSQTKGNATTPSKKTDQHDGNVNKLANGIANTSIGETMPTSTTTARSKNLDVLAELGRSRRKKSANFVVIGHVDAGKSTLMGRLLYDLKVVDQRTIDRYRKEAETIGKSSFALAWVLDSGIEERNRGVTIDIAMNKFETDSTSFTILDAPGHKDFIPNMIAGASQADFAVLVIDASPNSFESGLRGQTKEHALLVRSMGVQRLVVAINKLDTIAWSQDRFEEIQQQVSSFLLAAGFQSKKIAYIPCSGLTGENITSPAKSPAFTRWYTTGPTLLAALEHSDPITHALEKPFRLTIADVFRGSVQNPLSVSGRIEAGHIQIGDKILAQPAGETAVVKALDADADADNDSPPEWAVAGQNVTLHLSDIDPVHLQSGDVLCSVTEPVKVVKSFTTKILAFEHVTPGFVDVLRGRLKFEGRIVGLEATLDKASGVVKKKKPRLVRPGEVARVKVEVVLGDGGRGVPLDEGGRMVLRSGGETVAAGLVE
ncbi:Hsp70 suppressor, GTPase facilitates ribosomal subunit dissociation [Agyrium rufum]|nr:Hsp70 suppressor, GTPase facilitates ribosomal subunit dissociation [Agyrium rufum]